MNNNKITGVVHSNQLVEASYSLNLDELRLIIIACSKLNSNEKNPGWIRVYGSDFNEFFNLSENNVHRNLVNSIKSLAGKSLTVPIDIDRNAVIPWLSLGIYDKQPDCGSHVVIEFSKYLEPFLFELEGSFTTLELEYVTQLNTPFSFRLYQWLKRVEKLHKNKRGKGVVVELSLSWMKERAGLSNSYDVWRDFRNRVINPAVEKINANTDITVTYEVKKTGKSVTSLEFFYIKEKSKTSKPVRPRLKNRPHVVKGSHIEGEWAKHNLRLLTQYELDLQNYDYSLRLETADIKKCLQYATILGDDLAKKHFSYQLKKNIRKPVLSET